MDFQNRKFDFMDLIDQEVCFLTYLFFCCIILEKKLGIEEKKNNFMYP